MDNIKVGDLVEDCSLMPGVVMSINGDTVQVRRLDYDSYSGTTFSCCSLRHCGVEKINANQVLSRLRLGIDRLSPLWRESESMEEYEQKIAHALNQL